MGWREESCERYRGMVLEGVIKDFVGVVGNSIKECNWVRGGACDSNGIGSRMSLFPSSSHHLTINDSLVSASILTIKHMIHLFFSLGSTTSLFLLASSSISLNSLLYSS